MTQHNHNPLTQFYRVPRFSVTLPSLGAFYDPGVVDLSDGAGVSILPMTAADESILKNPDALLTGEAVMSVLKSCVPAVKAPRKLFSCDVDALLVGIRAASYGNTNEIEARCPSCSAENSYTVDFEALLESSEPLESHYEVVLSTGVTVSLAPSTFDAVIKQQRAYFEGSKLERLMRDDKVSDEARLKMFSESFNRLNKLNFELIVDSIIRVEAIDSQGQQVQVTERKHIMEYMHNIEGSDVKLIEKKIAEINSHGVRKNLDATCRNCAHEWKVPVEYNDTNFFLGS